MSTTTMDIECPYCRQSVDWVTIQTGGELANVPGMLNFLSKQTGEDFSDWNITEAYYFEHDCGRGFVVAEVPDACEPDQNGYSAPAYLTIGLHGQVGPGERLLPLRVDKVTNSEVRLGRDSLKRVK